MKNITILILQYAVFVGAIFIQWSKALQENKQFNNKIFFFKKAKMQLKHKKRFMQCMEKVLWLIHMIDSNKYCSQIDQLKAAHDKSTQNA